MNADAGGRTKIAETHDKAIGMEKNSLGRIMKRTPGCIRFRLIIQSDLQY